MVIGKKYGKYGNCENYKAICGKTDNHFDI